jgi:hypothetical protein
MTYYAIRNKKTRQYISGTDYRVSASKPCQIMSSALRPPLLISGATLQTEILVRHINLKYYEIVAVEIKEKEPIQ